MNQNFRSSLHGFNRQDVANYLEYLNNRHAAQVNQLNTDLEELRRQVQTPAADPQRLILESRCRELEQQLRQAQSERDEALAQKEEALRKLEDALLRVSGEKLDANRELEAYRRAERTERVARERAEQVYSETGTVLTQASNRIDTALRQMTGISRQVSTQLDTLQAAISSSRLALQDAADTIEKLKPGR